MFGRAEVSMETSHTSGICNQRHKESVNPSRSVVNETIQLNNQKCVKIQCEGYFLKMSMGACGAVVRRLDAGTSQATWARE